MAYIGFKLALLKMFLPKPISHSNSKNDKITANTIKLH